MYKETGMIMCLCSRVASGRVVRSPGLTNAALSPATTYSPGKRVFFCLWH